MADVPKDRRYTKSHEWALKKDDLIVVGITDFAVHELSDLVFIDLPEVGKKLKAGDPFGEIESVKAVSELMAPVSGKVVEVNETLENRLETLVESPFGEGWMIKIQPSSAAEYDKLLSKADYEAQLEAHE
ncbi:MAG: glycine cleavage system protein GcvH [Planctomycetes bacterium]|nr:glycine cleavage system protein GcvH [Planctomycetota bacterium]